MTMNRNLPAVLAVIIGGSAVIGATFCGSSNRTPKAVNNPSGGGDTSDSGGVVNDPSKPNPRMDAATPPKQPEPTPTKDASSAPATSACPATAPKLLDPCDDTTGRGCTYKSGTCNNLYYCFEGVWAAAKQTTNCSANPDVCPSSISTGATCKPGSASDVESWMTAGAYPCVLASGSICTCDADLPCGAPRHLRAAAHQAQASGTAHHPHPAPCAPPPRAHPVRKREKPAAISASATSRPQPAAAVTGRSRCPRPVLDAALPRARLA